VLPRKPDGIERLDISERRVPRRIDSVSKITDLCGSPNQRRNGQDLEVITPGPGAESEGVQTQAAIRINHLLALEKNLEQRSHHATKAVRTAGNPDA